MSTLRKQFQRFVKVITVSKLIANITLSPQIAFFAFMNSGQVCLCLKRIYIHESIYSEFREALVRHVKTLKVGDGAEPNVTHGPLQNAMQYERVKGFFADIKKENMKVAIGGTIDPSNGYFVNPTIIDNPADNSRLVVEEPFGKYILLKISFGN
jgi:acyl-CoA reductase-like NAD-dependent aldehyde dehydrogenase